MTTSIGDIANRSNVATNAARWRSWIGAGPCSAGVDKPGVLRQRGVHHVDAVHDLGEPGRPQRDQSLERASVEGAVDDQALVGAAQPLDVPSRERLVEAEPALGRLGGLVVEPAGPDPGAGL